MKKTHYFLNGRVQPASQQVVPVSGWLTCVLLFVLLLSSCKKEPETQPANTLTALAGNDQQVQVGQLVTLDGSASHSAGNQPFSTEWVLLRKPAKSTVTLTGATTLNPTFTPDEVGEYELELTLSNTGGRSIDRVLVVASVAQPLTLDKDITVKTLLTDRIVNPSLPDYIVPRSLAVKAELTLAPGVVIAFERDVRLSINDDGGVLIAQGTAEKKIRFLGVQQTKGYWEGIMLFSKSNANLMEWVEVMHAGSRPMLDNTKMGMAMFKQGQMGLKRTLFSQNDGYGLYLYDEAVLREFSANSFTSNTEAGIILPAESVARLDASSQFTGGNGHNTVDVKGEYIGNNSTPGTEIAWTGFADKTPYRLLRRIQVRAGWKLNQGVTIEADRDIVIIIDESGYLNAVGTSAQKITFTGVGGSAAYWVGIRCHSASSQNRLENVELLNAGSLPIISTKRASLALYGVNATMTLRNARIAGGGGYGIYVGPTTSLNADNTVTYANNTLANVLNDN